MTSRETLLREMGLTPIWRPHQRPFHGATTANATSVSDKLQTAVKTPDAQVLDPVVPQISASNSAISSAEARATAIAAMSWDELTTSIANCTACKLCQTRTQTVPGVGDHNPDWMIVGEAPGEQEDKRGEPFVGKAGHLLDAMLTAISRKRGCGGLYR